MERKHPLTYFDSPNRSTQATIDRTARDVANAKLLVDLLEGFPTPAVVLDLNRQIVAANARALAAFDVLSVHDIHGLRLGEALSCVCAHVMPAGCGTSRSCAECGAAHSIHGAVHGGNQTVNECRITTKAEGRERSYDFRVFATPMQVGHHRVTIVALEDISDAKRRDTLERIFFHDVMGAANAVHGLARLLTDGNEELAKHAAESLSRATSQLLEEIQAQRDLMLAERGELATRPSTTVANEIVEAVHQQYRWSPLAEGRELVTRLAPKDCTLEVDRVQLIRSLGNLVRNALEAVGEGAQVAISAEPMADGVLFQVANPGEIPPNVQLQVFQRSFSTKASRGRGIGTYSVKLIVEQYLKGRVSFVSADTGTVFSIWVPK